MNCLFCSQPTELIIYSRGPYRRKLLLAEVARRQGEEKNGHTRPVSPPLIASRDRCTSRARHCSLPVHRPTGQAYCCCSLSRPPAPFSFKVSKVGGTERPQTWCWSHRIILLVLSVIKLQRMRAHQQSGVCQSMVYQPWGSRSSETAFVCESPGQSAGGGGLPGVLAVRQATRVSARCRGCCTTPGPVDSTP